MCKLITVAAACSLPTFPYDGQRQRIAVTDLTLRSGAVYHTRLVSLPYAYNVTSRNGCGCDLCLSPEDLLPLCDDDAAERERQILRAAMEDYEALVDLVAIGLEAGPVEIFTCWDSDCFSVEIGSRRQVTLREFRRPGFALVERELLTITAAA
jgi:hypothetical protein